MVATPALTCAYDSHQSTSVQANSHSFVGVLWVLSMRQHRPPWLGDRTHRTSQHVMPAS